MSTQKVPPGRGYVVAFCASWIAPGWVAHTSTATTKRLRSAYRFATAYEASQYAHYGPVYSYRAAESLGAKP
ncbi:MAG TPA: hypothetical protein VNM48_23485 [Chloroflexota bacterium]|nr:hypothetical protein [Chloroflexota bacterium]